VYGCENLSHGDIIDISGLAWRFSFKGVFPDYFGTVKQLKLRDLADGGLECALSNHFDFLC
jgi:hypothetical protein